MRTDRWGIDDGYEDCNGRWRPTPRATRAALIEAMGGEGPAHPRVRFIGPGEHGQVKGPGELHFEDGGVVRLGRFTPSPELPPGYHELHRPNGKVERIVVTPRRCRLLDGMRAWGWTAQLYAARSAKSWGIGDLADLRELASWSAHDLGAGFLVMNPVFASTPILPQQPSPYYPSSRRYRNPLYLRIEEVPGARERLPMLERLAAEGRALNAGPLIDRDRIWRMKMDALELLWDRFGGDARFNAYREREGDALRQFATFCALAEHFRSGWREWPSGYRDPRSPAVARFAAGRDHRVRFHEWVQWMLDAQMEAAARPLALVQDLPVGADANGADAWVWQDYLADGVTFGAPPDPYSATGQDWGLPPFIPHRLRAACYEPFIQTVRAAMRHAGGLRIDHVMGLFRLFWIPRGARPTEGSYVRYPADELLDIVALESHRAGAFVIGEDLGTVEPGVREKLADRRVLSTRLLWFEETPPRGYPQQSLASITTHDLPTIAGLWTGADLEEQRALGMPASEDGARKLRDRLAQTAGVPAGAPAREAIAQAHELLAEAPSVAVTATLEDALAVERRPNLPSTTNERPNWSIALPESLEALRTNPLARTIAAALQSRRHAATLSNRG